MKLAVIGAGKMGQAIAGRLLEGTYLGPDAICGVSPVAADRDAFASLGGSTPLVTHEEIAPALAGATVALISVKPQHYPEIAPQLAQAGPELCFISIMAGITLEALESSLGRSRPIIRCMPNTPLLVGQGAVAWCANSGVKGEQLQLADRIFGEMGTVVQVDEPQLDAVTALSGSGPAFFFRIMQHLIDAAMAEGLPEKTARLLAAQTAVGSGALLQQAGEEIETLIANVRSKGGTTEAGLEAMESEAGTLEAILHKTIQAAAKRSRELAKP
jgi:pyrroline-5-carboxylate reductase